MARAHGAQDAYVAALVLHQHDQPRRDVERGNDDDDSENQEHHVALDLERTEERGVALAPVDQEDWPSGGVGEELAVVVDAVRILGIDLDRGDVTGAVEIGLCLRQRHEHEGGVVFRHADLEHRGDLVGLDARRRPHRRDRPAWRDQRDHVAHAQGQLIGEPAPDRDALPFVEAIEGALADVVSNRRQLAEIGGTHAAHQHAGRVERRRCQRLAFDDGCRQLYSLDP